MRLPTLSLRRKITLTAGVGALLIVGAVATFAATDPAATLHAQEVSLLQQQAALYTQQAQLSTNLATVEQQLLALDNGGTTTTGTAATAANALPGVGSTTGTTAVANAAIATNGAAPATQAAMYNSVAATDIVTHPVSATDPTPRQANGGGDPTGTTADVSWDLTPAEQTALVGNTGPIDFVAQSKAVGATAPAYNTLAAQDWTNLLYDRLRILSNYYDNSYTGTSTSADNASLGSAIQETQQQIYNWVNGSADSLNNGVTIPYNQFIANEGVYDAGSAAVKALIVAAAPTGAPSADGMGVYQSNSGTDAYRASLANGTAPGTVAGGINPTGTSATTTAAATNSATTTAATAARIATLQAAITTDAAKATTQFAAGNKITSASLQAKVTLFTSELAALQK
jgi:hypothetical protein